MALALGLVGQPVQPYLTTGATDFVNSVQKGKEDAIKTEELKTQNQKSALDLLSAQKKQKDEQWYSDNAGALSRKVKTFDVADEDLARMAQVNPEYHKVLQTERADAVKNFNASNLAYLGSSTDKAKSAQEIIQASEAHGMTIPDQFKQSPETLMQYLKVINAGSKAFDLKNVSKDESGDIITTDITGNTTDIKPAAVKAEKPVPVMVNGKPKTVKVPGTNEVKILMSDGTLSAGGSMPAPKADKTELTFAQKATYENQLRNEYRADSKTFLELKRQTAIIRNSLNDPSAAGTLSAATAYMKMLDPGSVVRESELGMAMQATGALDRLNNYFHTLEVGKTLTATQKEDFGRLAGQYMEAADQAQENLNKTYTEIAVRNKLTPENIIMFKPDKKPNTQPIQVKTADDYNRLKSGDVYIDPKGVKRTKS